MTCRRAREIDFAAYLAEPRAGEWSDFRTHYPGCPDCSAELRRWTQLEGALRDVTGADAHPSDEVLLAFRRAPDSLAAIRRDEVSAHLAECAPCRDAVGAVVSPEVARLLSDDARPVAASAVPAHASPASLAERLRGLFAIPTPARVALAVVVLLLALGIPWLYSGDPEPTAPMARREAPVTPPPDLAPESTTPDLAPTDTPPDRIAGPAPGTPEAPGPPSPPVVEDVPAPDAPEPGVVIADSPPSPEASPKPTPPPEPPPTPTPPRGGSREPAPLLVASLGSEPLGFRSRPGLPAARTAATMRGAGAATVRPLALTPREVGLTLESQPILYWFLPAPTDADIRIDLNDVDAMKSLLSKALPGPFAAGIHALRLEDHGVRLATGGNYQWLLTPAGTDEPASGGIVRRIAPEASLQTTLAAATPPQRVRSLAAEGIWHDALELISRSIDSRPQDAELRGGRAQLLEQVGLDSAAAWDRSGG